MSNSVEVNKKMGINPDFYELADNDQQYQPKWYLYLALALRGKSLYCLKFYNKSKYKIT